MTRFCFQIFFLFLALVMTAFAGQASAQFDVVYVKGKVYYKKSGDEETLKEVKVGDKIERTTPLDFSKDPKAYVALYNPSYGRIVIPDKEEVTTYYSGERSIRTLRDQRLRDSYDFFHKALDRSVFLSDTAKVDLSLLMAKDALAEDLTLFIDSLKIIYRYKYYADDSSLVTVEKTIRDFYTDFKGGKLDLERRNRDLPLGRKQLYRDSSGNTISPQRIFGMPELILRTPDHLEDSEKNSKLERKAKQIKNSIYLRHPENTEELKKEVQTLINGNIAAGKKFSESVTEVIPYIKKYYGKVFPEDVDTWIRENFTFEIKR